MAVSMVKTTQPPAPQAEENYARVELNWFPRGKGYSSAPLIQSL